MLITLQTEGPALSPSSLGARPYPQREEAAKPGLCQVPLSFSSCLLQGQELVLLLGQLRVTAEGRAWAPRLVGILPPAKTGCAATVTETTNLAAAPLSLAPLLLDV